VPHAGVLLQTHQPDGTNTPVLGHCDDPLNQRITNPKVLPVRIDRNGGLGLRRPKVENSAKLGDAL